MQRELEQELSEAYALLQEQEQLLAMAVNRVATPFKNTSTAAETMPGWKRDGSPALHHFHVDACCAREGHDNGARCHGFFDGLHRRFEHSL